MSADTEKVVYFHGVPGSPAELELFRVGNSMDIALFAPDRGSDYPSLDFPDYLAALHLQIGVCHPTEPIRLIGFSLGARMALEIAARLGERVSQVDLVSAAAPLACGVKLSDMAGGVVFRIARDAPKRFALLTAAQGFLSRVAPSHLTRMIFASAMGEDAGLVSDPQFMRVIRRLLRQSLTAGSMGYRREMLAFASAWEDILPRVKAPVTLWHGDRDNWAPPMMAEWLKLHLPNVTALHLLRGKSHYSALAHYWNQRSERERY